MMPSSSATGTKSAGDTGLRSGQRTSEFEAVHSLCKRHDRR
jgi:hypothetical protein